VTGDGGRRLNVRELTNRAALVPYAKLLESIPRRFQQHVRARFDDGVLVPPGSFSAFVEAVRRLVPQTNPILDRFSAGASLSSHNPAQTRAVPLRVKRKPSQPPWLWRAGHARCAGVAARDAERHCSLVPGRTAAGPND
jgi:hypothetical protein